MTKYELINILHSQPGIKITHHLFEPDEYIFSKEDGNVYDENGFLFEDWTGPYHDGIRLRTGVTWDTGWTIWREANQIQNKDNHNQEADPIDNLTQSIANHRKVKIEYKEGKTYIFLGKNSLWGPMDCRERKMSSLLYAMGEDTYETLEEEYKDEILFILEGIDEERTKFIQKFVNNNFTLPWRKA